MSSPEPESPRNDRRRIHYSLGSLLAFIAGMAVMLTLLVPFIKTGNSLDKAQPLHAGLSIKGITSKNCTSCHSGMTADSQPK